MDNNPYQAPKSNIAIQGKFKRSVWWKIYFFFITILTAFGMVSFLADPEVGIAEYIYFPLWMVGTAGFFGFVFIKPVYKPEFWLKFVIVYVAYLIIYYFITKINLRMGMTDTAFYITTAISWLISLPAYYALYAYSKPSNPAWENA